MRRFHASAQREDRWWVIEVPDVGTTQGRTTTEGAVMAVGMIAAMLDIDEADIAIDIDWLPPKELAKEVAQAREEVARAAEAQQRAAVLSRQAVAHLLEHGLSKRDTARVLKLAPQRITQLTR